VSPKIWNEGLSSDTTYVVLSTSNGTIIGLRDRASGTLYLSPVILGSQQPPEVPANLTQIIIALQIAAVDDAMGCAVASGWDRSQIPKPSRGGSKAPSESESPRMNEGGKASSYDLDGISLSSSKFPVSIVPFIIFSMLKMVVQLINAEEEVSTLSSSCLLFIIDWDTPDWL
jgi:hypothetical protein